LTGLISCLVLPLPGGERYAAHRPYQKSGGAQENSNAKEYHTKGIN